MVYFVPEIVYNGSEIGVFVSEIGHNDTATVFFFSAKGRITSRKQEAKFRNSINYYSLSAGMRLLLVIHKPLLVYHLQEAFRKINIIFFGVAFLGKNLRQVVELIFFDELFG